MCTVSNTIENITPVLETILSIFLHYYFQTSKPLCSKGHLCHYGGNELEKGRAV